MNKKIYYNWEQFDDDVEYFGKYYKKANGLIKNIYAVPRGGLIFGVALSHYLEIPLILDKNRIKSHTLVVDDISDTGATLKRLLKNKQYYDVATLWMVIKTTLQRIRDGDIQTHYKKIKGLNEWVVFPWETIKSSKYDRTT